MGLLDHAVFRITVAYLKHKIENEIGAEALEIAGEEVAGLGGEQFKTTVENILNTREGSQKFAEAMDRLRSCLSTIKDDDVRGAFLSINYATLPTVETNIRNLNDRYDEQNIAEIIRSNLRQDFPKLSDKQIEEGVLQFLHCLRVALLPLDRYTSLIIGKTVLDSEEKLRQMGKEQTQIKEIVTNIQSFLQRNKNDAFDDTDAKLESEKRLREIREEQTQIKEIVENIQLGLQSGKKDQLEDTDTYRNILHVISKHGKEGIPRDLIFRECARRNFVDNEQTFELYLWKMLKHNHVEPTVDKIRITIQGTNHLENLQAPVLEKSILLVTVKKEETLAVLHAFSISPDRLNIVRTENKTYFDLGKLGTNRVFLIQTEMGTATPAGSLITIPQAIKDQNPSAIILCGFACGLQPGKQNLGDILISRQIHCYEPHKKNFRKQQIPRGDRVTVSERLLDRFRTADLNWNGAKTHFGLVLSGEVLVNDPVFRKALLRAEPEAIGCEMEGAGLYVAARDAKVDWIIVKAICDWGDGNKNDDYQRIAARNAAQFVYHTIKTGIEKGG